MILELQCHPQINSCIDCAAKEPVSVGETVYIYTFEDRYTDESYPGWVRATVTEAWKDCGCWNYKLRLFEEDLPSGIANLSQYDIANIGCEPEAVCDPIDAPSALTAEATCFEDTLQVEWADASDDETGFELQRAPGSGPAYSWTTIDLGPNVTSHEDSGLSANEEWSYRIRAVRAGTPTVVSEWSNIDAATTAQHGVPTDLTATAVSDTQIDLTWTDNASAETGFEIQRSLDGSTGWATVLTPAADETSDSDTGLDPETQYFYRIRAVGAGGTFSCWSTEVEAAASDTTEAATVPDAPSLLVANATSDSEIDLTWQDNSDDETGFEIERSLDGSTGWAQVLTPAADAEADTDTGLDPETEYFYRVRAVNGVGPSAWSNIASDTTLATALWFSQTSSDDNDWTSVAFGNGVYVAVASTGVGSRVMTSPDGLTWTTRVSAEDSDWRSVAYGLGLFVVVADAGTNRVMTSPDGITWTAQPSAPAYDWVGVEYSGTLNMFLAVAVNGTNRVMTSSDGVTWAEQTQLALPLRSIAWGGGLFVATRFISGIDFDGVYTSPDGVVWTARTTPQGNWQSVVWGGGLWVAVSSNGSFSQVMTSPDGITWTDRTIASGFWNKVRYVNGRFIAIASLGSNGFRAASSPDGIIWTLEATPVDNAWQGLTVGEDNRFVAVSTSGAGDRVMTRALIPGSAPAAPTVLAATPGSVSSEIDLTWTNNATDETGFELERSPDGIGSWVLVRTPSAGDTAHTDTGLDPTTQYFYRIRAVNFTGQSAYSNVDDATTSALALPKTADMDFDGDASSMNFGTGDWTDLSAAGNDWSLVSGALPTEEVSWGNGLSAIVTGGALRAVGMTVDLFHTADDVAGAATLAMAAEVPAIGSNPGVFVMDFAGGATAYFNVKFFSNGDIKIGRNAGSGVVETTIATGYTAGAKFVLCVSQTEGDASTFRYRFNALPIDGFTNTPAGAGNGSSGQIDTAAVVIGEYIIWNTDLSDAEIEEVMTYLGNKFALPV